MSTKRIIITSVCILAIVASLWQKETLNVLANRLLATEQAPIQQQEPSAEAIKILEIQETANFRLTLPVEVERDVPESQPVHFIQRSEEVEAEKMLAQQPVEVHQYTWEQFKQEKLTFTDFDGLVLGEFEQPLELSWQQEDELSQLSQQSWPIYAAAETLQVDLPVTLEAATTDLVTVVQTIESRQAPVLEILSQPSQVAKGETQEVYVQLLVKHPSSTANLTITATIKDGTTNTAITLATQKFENEYANKVISFDFREVQIPNKNQPVYIAITATIEGQTTTKTITIPVAGNDYVIIYEKLIPPSDEGYLLGDELVVNRTVTALASSQNEKICSIESSLKIAGQEVQKLPPTPVPAENMDKINQYLQKMPNYKLTLPANLNLSQQPIVIMSEVKVKTGTGNCMNNIKYYTGTGYSLIKLRKGELKVEFVDNRTGNLLSQPYEVKVNEMKQTNVTGQLVFGPLKTAGTGEYSVNENIPPEVLLRYRELVKREIFNNDGSVGSLPAQLKYSNPVMKIRYYFDAIDPLDGKINFGLDNNQFQLENHPKLTVTPNSFLTLGAKFTLKEKPDAIVISTPQKGNPPVVYNDLYHPSLIDWTYDETAKQWRGIPNLNFYTTFPNIKTTPETFFIRWSVKMPSTLTQTGIQIEPGSSVEHQRMLPLIPYSEENQGAKTLPDLF